MEIAPSDFLDAHRGTWIARRAGDYPVINVHVSEMDAPAERVYALLESPDLIAPGWHWRVAYGLRGAAGKLFGWDKGLRWHARQPLAPGNHYAFFTIEHVAGPGSVHPPWEVGMSVANRLTRALMSLIVEDANGGTRVWNVTCAVFHGRLGRAYWRVVRPFHNLLIEDSLSLIRARARQG